MLHRRRLSSTRIALSAVLVLSPLLGGTIAQAQTGVRLRGTLNGHRKNILDIAFSPDGETIATGSEDGTVRLWGTATGALRLTLTVADKCDWLQLSWSPDGRLLATFSTRSANDRGELKIWDARAGALRAILAGHLSQVNKMEWSPDGRALLTTGGDGTAKLWNPASGELVLNFEQEPPPPGETNSLLGAIFTGKKLADWHSAKGYFDGDGKSLLTVSPSRPPRLWDAATGKLKTLLPLAEVKAGEGEYPYWVEPVLSPDRRLVVRHDRHGVALLDTTTGQLKYALGDIGEPLAFSPDGETLLTVEYDPPRRFNRPSTLSLREVTTGRRRMTFEKFPELVLAAFWSPGGGTIVAVVGYGLKTHLLSTKTGRVQRLPQAGCVLDEVFASSGYCAPVIFNADGRVLLRTYKRPRLWDANTGDFIAELGAASRLSVFSPTDGRVLVTRGEEKKTALLWEVTVK